MSEKSNGSSGGIGFTGLLTIVFITLKLIGKINWSWVWVLSPLWIGLAIVLLALLIMVIIAAIASAFSDKRYSNYYKPKRTTWQQRLDEMAKRRSKV